MAIGNFKDAMNYFDIILKNNPKSHVWFGKEVSMFYWETLDKNRRSFNIDKDIHPGIKEGHAIHTKSPEEFIREYPEYENLSTKFQHLRIEDQRPIEVPGKTDELLLLTAELARWVQVDSPGFMPNKRQYRMFGLAVLEAAQTLRRHIISLRVSGRGLEVPDSYSSRTDNISNEQQAHTFTWRDFFDIIVRWRQVSAFGDAVWWTDSFPKKEYKERHGITTWILDGSGSNVRCYLLCCV